MCQSTPLGSLRYSTRNPHGILDHEVHHEIARVLLDVEGLQYKAEVAEPKFRRALFSPFGMEAQVCVELLRQGKVFGRHKGFEIDDRRRRCEWHVQVTLVFSRRDRVQQN